MRTVDRIMDRMMSACCAVGSLIGGFMFFCTMMGGDWMSDEAHRLSPATLFGTQLFLLAATVYFVWTSRWYWRISSKR